jgi:hypothetical protein
VPSMKHSDRSIFPACSRCRASASSICLMTPALTHRVKRLKHVQPDGKRLGNLCSSLKIGSHGSIIDRYCVLSIESSASSPFDTPVCAALARPGAQRADYTLCSAAHRRARNRFASAQAT